MYWKGKREQEVQKQRYVVNINPENRWVKLSELMPWEKIEDYYSAKMCSDNGRGALSSRIAFGSIYAKETLHLTDPQTVEQISENPYLQYFLGVGEYQSRPLFDPSMMVHFRRRFEPEFIAKVNEYICTGKWSDDDDTKNPDDLPPPDEVEHKGKLLLDATAAPSDIRYPCDVILLDECRENLEKMIDEMWTEGEHTCEKTPYNRHNAHKKTINFIKKKQKSSEMIRESLNIQLNYVELAIRHVVMLILYWGAENITEYGWERFDVICRIYLQQKWMYDNNTNRCEGKIMNLRQPHVRAILRNKSRSKYEYGQKLALSKFCGQNSADGYVFIECQSWENFNECNTLQQSVLNYYNRFGCYPEVILADRIYRTRANIKFVTTQL
jgi:hypothetical protein